MEPMFMPTAGWLKTVLLNGTLGLWQVAQDEPKWFAGGVWQVAQSVREGWLNAHETPGFLWHAEHPLLRDEPWLLGGAWQLSQLEPTTE
jgi:hypothetical protein